MNGQQLVDRCEERFGDTGNAIVSATEWLSYVNSAYRDFLRRSKWPNLVQETNAVIGAGQRSVALPAAALQGGVVAAYVNGHPLERQPADLPIRNIRHWTDRPTIPIYWQVRGSRLVVLPAWSAGGTVVLSYLTAPAALTTVSSPIIPETYHDALISGALAMAYRDDGNGELAEQYQAEFDRALQGASGDNPTEIE